MLNFTNALFSTGILFAIIIAIAQKYLNNILIKKHKRTGPKTTNSSVSASSIQVIFKI